MAWQENIGSATTTLAQADSPPSVALASSSVARAFVSPSAAFGTAPGLRSQFAS